MHCSLHSLAVAEIALRLQITVHSGRHRPALVRQFSTGLFAGQATGLASAAAALVSMAKPHVHDPFIGPRHGFPIRSN